MKAKDLFFLVGLLSCFTATRILAQINVGVSNTPSVVNAYYPVSAISGNVVTVGTGTGISHTLAIGDKVLLVQMTGNTAANGGKFEYRTVTAVSGSDITLDGITRTYTPSTEKVQLVWIPYDPIGITIIANILAKPWDGSTGGIVGVLTDGTLTMNGSILANGAGFSGNETFQIYGEGVYGGGGGGGASFGGGGGGGGYGISNGAIGQGGTGGSNLGGASGGGSPNGLNGGGGGGTGPTYFNASGGTSQTGADGAPVDANAAGGGGGAGGVGGGGGGGGAGAHGGGGGGGASPTIAGCGGTGADNSENIGGVGAINGIGWTNGTYVGPSWQAQGGGGGGGGAFTGGGGGHFPEAYGNCSGGNGGGFVPANGYHSFFSCDASGNCSDPRIWMAGGAKNLSGNPNSRGGGIVMVKANHIITNNQVMTAIGEDGTKDNLNVAWGAGGGGLLVINTNQVTGNLALCAKGGNGVQAGYDDQHGWGSSGGGGNGVIWVNNPLGGVSSNINATATPPVVANMLFCTDGGLGGPQAPNPKSASFSGGGGCGGGGVIQVNPNAAIFGPTSTCSITLTANASTCNTSNNQYTLTGNLTITNAPTTGSLTIMVSGGGSVSYPVSSLPANYSISGLNADGASHTVTATFSDDNTCTNTATYTAPVACGTNPCPSPNCGSLSVQKNN